MNAAQAGIFFNTLKKEHFWLRLPHVESIEQVLMKNKALNKTVDYCWRIPTSEMPLIRDILLSKVGVHDASTHVIGVDIKLSDSWENTRKEMVTLSPLLKRCSNVDSTKETIEGIPLTSALRERLLMIPFAIAGIRTYPVEEWVQKMGYQRIQPLPGCIPIQEEIELNVQEVLGGLYDMLPMSMTQPIEKPVKVAAGALDQAKKMQAIKESIASQLKAPDYLKDQLTVNGMVKIPSGLTMKDAVWVNGKEKPGQAIKVKPPPEPIFKMVEIATLSEEESAIIDYLRSGKKLPEQYYTQAENWRQKLELLLHSVWTDLPYDT